MWVAVAPFVGEKHAAMRNASGVIKSKMNPILDLSRRVYYLPLGVCIRLFSPNSRLYIKES